MRLIRLVFNALKTFDRPATRRELERESGLSKDEVHKGLKGLARRSLIIAEVLARRGGTYRLVPGAKMPEDLRGRFVRDAAFCERVRRASLGYHAARMYSAHPTHFSQAGEGAPMGKYSVASPPAPSNAPGAVRLVIKGMLEGSSAIDAPMGLPCALAEFWKPR